MTTVTTRSNAGNGEPLGRPPTSSGTTKGADLAPSAPPAPAKTSQAPATGPNDSIDVATRSSRPQDRSAAAVLTAGLAPPRSLGVSTRSAPPTSATPSALESPAPALATRLAEITKHLDAKILGIFSAVTTPHRRAILEVLNSTPIAERPALMGLIATVKSDGQHTVLEELRTHVSGAEAAQLEAYLAKWLPLTNTAILDDIQAGVPFAVKFNEIDGEALAPSGRVPTLAELTNITATLSADPRVPFRYIMDGCYARAHIMCDSLRKAGVNCGKMFAYGDLTAKNDLMTAKWWYHVAPTVLALDESTGKQEMFVIDPSLSPKPLRPSEWLAAIATSDVRVDLTTAAQYQPIESVGRDTDFGAHMDAALETAKRYSGVLSSMTSP